MSARNLSPNQFNSGKSPHSTKVTRVTTPDGVSFPKYGFLQNPKQYLDYQASGMDQEAYAESKIPKGSTVS